MNLHDPVETVYAEIMLCASEEQFQDIVLYLCPSFRLAIDYAGPAIGAEAVLHAIIATAGALALYAAHVVIGLFA